MSKRKWNIEDIVSIVRNIARDELLPRFTKVKHSKKLDGSIITEADLAVQKRTGEELARLDASILFLGEEMSVEEQESLLQQQDKPVWILDPLDGTTNFAAGIPYYAVSLSLLECGVITLGIVYDPERDECFVAEKGQGASCNGEALNSNNGTLLLKNAVACIDLKRLPEELAVKIVRQHPFRSQRSYGGVALDWCWLAMGRFDVYLHGKQNIWDYGAGLLIYSETGGASCTLAGEQVFVPNLQPRSGVAAMNGDLFNEWKSFLGIKQRE